MQTVIRVYREARRRKVFRTGALYVLGAWLLLQVADVLFPGFGIPDTAIPALAWTAVLGFPLALLFGWLYDIGPGGIYRTPALGADEAEAPQPLTKSDYLILTAFAAVAVVLLSRAVQEVRESTLTNPPKESAAAERAASERLPDSIAVLPFVNISNDPGNDYFCDGISEEILNALSGFGGLNVIGRTSSFAFKGSALGIERISAVLGVGHVLQGSVRKAGQQLRISAQLVDHTGRQLWTETFDRELVDVFDIQEEIARSVATAAASRVVAQPVTAYHPKLEAYDHYLAGRALLHRRDVLTARKELQRARDLDPAFAEAHAEWAIAQAMGAPSMDEIDAARAAIERALELQPKLLRAQSALGLLLLQSQPPDLEQAERVLRRVLEQDPNTSDALHWLANALNLQERPDEAFELRQRAARIDPLHPAIAATLSDDLWERGRTAQAIEGLERHLEQPNPGRNPYFALGNIYRAMGRLVDYHALCRRQSRHLVGYHDSLALSYALLGNWNAAQYWQERSPRDFPGYPYSPVVSSVLPAWQGDHAQAARNFQQGIDASGTDLAQQSLEIRPWFGVVLARAGRHAEAIAILEPVHGQVEVGGLTDWSPELDARHALAWAYLNSGAGSKAETLLAEDWRNCQEHIEGLSHDSFSLHFCSETALLRGDRERALELLQQAVDAGWREYAIRQHDPYWALLETDPRYRALMDRVKADVDRQAMEIARLDATEDLAAQVDAALAGLRSREKPGADGAPRAK